MRQTVDYHHRKLLTFQNPQISAIIPQSHNTARAWIIDEYQKARQVVIEDMACAKSRIMISFDSWKADNEVLDLLGVVAHYIDCHYKVKTVTLALRDTYGSHTGDNMREHLLAVLSEY